MSCTRSRIWLQRHTQVGRYTYFPSSVCQEIGSGLNARLVIRYQQYLKNINIYKYQNVRYSYTFRLENYTGIHSYIYHVHDVND